MIASRASCRRAALLALFGSLAGLAALQARAQTRGRLDPVMAEPAENLFVREAPK
jgi:hypothetical protein